MDELFYVNEIEGFGCTSANPYFLCNMLCFELRALKPQLLRRKPFHLIATAKGYVAVRGDGVAVFRQFPNKSAPWLDSEILIPYATLREYGLGVVAEKLTELDHALSNNAA